MIELVKEAIGRTVTQFREHPLDFLSECDIQAWLFAELRYPETTRNLRYSYDDVKKVNERFGLPSAFSVHPVTTEYHVPPEGRFDVAVLSKQPDPNLEIWRQPCRIGIEIKLWQPCYPIPGYMKDVNKLQRYQKKLGNDKRDFTGISMLFINPHKTGTPKDILEELSPDAYPENGVVLHVIQKEDHRWKKFPALSVSEP